MAQTHVPHVFLVAAEESGDRLGAALITALRERTQGQVRFSAIGGEQMAQQSVPSLFPIGDLAIVGFTAIPPKLPLILRRIHETSDAVVAARPDVLVIIDSPDFTHRVARKVRSRTPRLPIIDYVCPSVWAWRPGRAKAMRAYVDHVLCLLPFEPDALKRLGGPPGTYVGHPLIECVDELRPNAAETERRASDPPVLLVLPGSRRGEVRRLADIFGAAVGMVAAKAGAVDVVVAAVPRLADVVRACVQNWSLKARVVSEPAEKLAAFRTARAALTKSGTSTLELALAGIPMVAAYKVSLPEEIVARRLIKVELQTVILANLVLGERVVPEFLQRDCTAEHLCNALLPLLSDTSKRRRQMDAFQRLDGLMGIGEGLPSSHAATVVLEYLQKAQ